MTVNSAIIKIYTHKNRIITIGKIPERVNSFFQPLQPKNRDLQIYEIGRNLQK